MRQPKRIPPGPGQESVWDYPRPPRVEPTSQHLQVMVDGVVIADTRRALRVLETSHPPTYYLPPEDVRTDLLTRNAHVTWCEFKGQASYYDLRLGARVIPNVAWSYLDPAPGYTALRGYLAFYPGRVDACLVDGELVRAQEGDFYGGWITSAIVGPFKGGRGRAGW